MVCANAFIFLCVGIYYSRPVIANRSTLIMQSSLRMMYLYLVWMLLYHVSFLFISHEEIGEGFIPLLRRIALPVLDLWFMAALALYFLIIFMLPKKRPNIQILVSLIVGQFAIAQGYHIRFELLYNFTFVLIGVYYRESLLKLIRYNNVAVPIAMVFIYLCVALNDPASVVMIPFLPQITSLAGVVAIITLLNACKQNFGVTLLRTIGRNSFEIYVMSSFWVTLNIALLPKYFDADNPFLYNGIPLILSIMVIAGCMLTKRSLRRLTFLFQDPRNLTTEISQYLVQKFISIKADKAECTQNSEKVTLEP